MSKVNRKILKEYEIKTYCKPLGRPPKEPRSPEYLEKMAKAVGERSRMLFRHKQEDISSQQHQGQVSRNSRMLDRNVLLCLAIFEFWLNYEQNPLQGIETAALRLWIFINSVDIN